MIIDRIQLQFARETGLKVDDAQLDQAIGRIAAKIKVGQKVSLSLDAIDGLKIDGTVSEVDLVGTVSQGVVTYSVKIALETQDERIRSGMSISATIVTESKKDILIIPNGSIKNNMVQTKTGFIKIKTGITNDSMTEVLEGLKEGDEIVTKTVAGTKTTSTTAPSILGNVRAAGANRAR
jgi:HlyD family secretion protein